MTVKANNSAAWLGEVQSRADRLEKLMKRKEPKLDKETVMKLADDTRRSIRHEARELIAAAQILCEELAVEASKSRI